MSQILKKCAKCNIDKELWEFGINNKTKDNLKTWCNDCYKEYNRNRYQANREETIQRSLKWQEENKNKVYKNQKRYRERLKRNEPPPLPNF